MVTEKKRVEIVVTDGDEIRRLIWIVQGADGSFYWGLVVPKSDTHSTYHASGRFQFSKHHKPSEWAKLSEFKGIKNLASVAVIKDLKKITFKPFKLSRLDGVVYVDFRSMKKDTVNIHLYLIEPGHPESLKGVLSIPSEDKQITIFTVMKPWLAVAASSV